MVLIFFRFMCEVVYLQHEAIFFSICSTGIITRWFEQTWKKLNVHLRMKTGWKLHPNLCLATGAWFIPELDLSIDKDGKMPSIVRRLTIPRAATIPCGLFSSKMIQ